MREGGGYGVVVERGKEWGHSHIVASHSLVHARLHTWAVGGCTCGGDRARAGGMVATSVAHGDVAPASWCEREKGRGTR